MNLLIRKIAEICSEHRLAEKRLIAPSKRIGRQWLDQVAGSGVPVLNARIETTKSMAMEIIARAGNTEIKILDRQHVHVIVANLLANLAPRNQYFKDIPITWTMVRAFSSTIGEFRASGLSLENMSEHAFSPQAKGSDILQLYKAYMETISQRDFKDEAQIYIDAAKALAKGEVELPAHVIVIIPASLALSKVQRYFFSNFDEARVYKIDDLKNINEPDVELSFNRAIGEKMEVRAVLRTCVEMGIPLDKVELVNTDDRFFDPLVYEEMQHIFGTDDFDDLPGSFENGLPAFLFNPSRALKSWVSWISRDFPQTKLTRMLKSGLLTVPKTEFSSAGLAATLQSLPIYQGRDRYLDVISRALSNSRPVYHGSLKPRGLSRDSLAVLYDLVKQLLNSITGTKGLELIESAQTFLNSHARTTNFSEEHTRQQLLDSLNSMVEALRIEGVPRGFDAANWLAVLPDQIRVAGRGPGPGRMHVTSLKAGCHTGREFTFFVGMDDSRFPGPGIQDPLVLDSERSALSVDLAQRSREPSDQIERFKRLLSGLQGKAVISYSCWNTLEGREMFPSPVLLDLTRRRGADSQSLAEIKAFIGPAITFIPSSLDNVLNSSEIWSLAGCRRDGWYGNTVEMKKALVSRLPFLKYGLTARAARQSGDVGVFDGVIGRLPDLDPGDETAGPLSASMLQDLLDCPFYFFMNHVLGLEPFQEYEPDPTKWLDPAARGQLMHSFFKEAVEHVKKSRDVSDEDIVSNVLEPLIEEYKQLYPVLDIRIFERERASLEDLAYAFLFEERIRGTGEPLFMEVAVGLSPDSKGTPLDSREPVTLNVKGEISAKFRARIDRIDRVTGNGGYFEVWDYKTGGVPSGAAQKPFKKGKLLQGLIYVLVAEHALKKHFSKNARVRAFGFLYTGARDFGLRIEWPRQCLVDGEKLLCRLLEMIRKGCFPIPPDQKEKAWMKQFADISEYADISGVASFKTKEAAKNRYGAIEPYIDVLEFE
ncbi:MAG: PD-(D/E)XK nuclease family protein [Deltaproteobacteria bacterium]|nr:PD-(D/E)XK nuclease family protein [Deltaproteobacteria bacterium]